MNHNRIPRRPPRVQPPSRRRSAASPSLGRNSQVLPVVPKPSPASRSSKKLSEFERACLAFCHRYPYFLTLYHHYPGVFRLLDQPWKWLVALLILMGLAFLLGALLF